MRFTEQLMLDLLERKHSEDVFVSHCKNGSTWLPKGTLRAFDAWVLKRTWSPVTAIAYEVKVNRQDFLKDEKWVDALPYCHQFYFVCPPKLISEKEVAKEVGLVWASSNASQLFTKRKAPRRQVQLPVELPLYVLMSRAKIVGSTYNQPKEGMAFWKEWLAEKEEKQRLAIQVSKRIRAIYEQMERECHGAQRKMESYDKIVERLKSLGIDLSSQTIWDAYQKIDEMGGRDIQQRLDALIKEMTQFSNRLKSCTKPTIKPSIKRPMLRLPGRRPPV